MIGVDLQRAPGSGRERQAWPLALLLLGAAVLATRGATLPGFVESVDGWQFVRGVERYSVAELRPHWPGYPVYIAAGRLLLRVAGSASAALQLLSLLASAACALCVAWLARAWAVAAGASPAAAALAGFGSGAVFAATPLAWLSGIRIQSDGFGLAIALLILCVAWHAIRAPRPGRWLLAAGALAGLLLGARLAYLPLLLPAAYAGWLRRDVSLRVAGRRVGAARLALLALCAGVLLWAGWQLALEGAPLLTAARARLQEHFGAWWMRTLSDGRWWQRPLELARTFAVHGLGIWLPGTPASRLPASLALATLLGAGLRAAWRHPDRRVAHLIGLFAAGQLLGVLSAHDPALDRHALPLVAAACLPAGLALPRAPRAAAAALLLVLATLGGVSAPLAAEQAATPPPAHLLARYAATRLDTARSTLLVTEDVAYVALFLEELAPGVRAERLTTSELEVAGRRLAAQGRVVYATAPSPLFPGEWTPVACFRRAPLVESRGPMELWLYRRGPWAGHEPSRCFGPGAPLAEAPARSGRRLRRAAAPAAGRPTPDSAPRAAVGASGPGSPAGRASARPAPAARPR